MPHSTVEKRRAYQRRYYDEHRRERNDQIKRARWRRLAGTPLPRGRPKRWTDLKLQRLLSQYNTGRYSWSQLGAFYGISASRACELVRPLRQHAQEEEQAHPGDVRGITVSAAKL